MNKEVEVIIKTVCEESNITFVELCSKRRSGKLTKARIIFVILCQKILGSSLAEIGKYISKNHATISRYEKRYEEENWENAFISNKINYFDMLYKKTVKEINNGRS